MSGRKWLISWRVVLFAGILLIPFATIAHARKLIIAVGQEPSSMDVTLNSLGPDYIVTDNFAEYLVSIAPSGKIVPGIATSWKISPDEKEMEFTLRKGVKFHSGDPLTARDVEFSLERGRAKNSTARIRLKSMDRVEVIDDYRFKIHFKEPDASFIPGRGGVPIVSKTYYDRVGEDRFTRQPVGTSPYKLVQHVPGEYVDVERFEDYWGEKPSVKEARFYFVPEDTTRVAKLKAGEVDLINSCPYSYVGEIERSKEFKAIKFEVSATNPSILFHNFNPKTPWYDRRVRLAMAYAIDCNAIIKNLLYGYPERVAFLNKDEVGYDPTLKPYPYDPQKAKALLAEAGYPKGFDLKLYWEITGRYPMAREIAEAAASYFEAVGIRTKLIGEESVQHFSRMRAAKKPDGEFVGCRTYGRGSEPSLGLSLHFASDGGNGIYFNPEFDKFIAEARRTINDTKRGDLIRKAVRILYDDGARIPICDLYPFYAMKKDIDFTPTKGVPHQLVLVKDVTIK